ncbi:MAG: hypothetical protein A2Y10_05825 [Planctomycetes bacterium GWF2_41_51]|nr:MAG: hypothetical protein A2Y10_05825 [Planctomycetes bacterium GWF2_41_51]
MSFQKFDGITKNIFFVMILCIGMFALEYFLLATGYFLVKFLFAMFFAIFCVSFSKYVLFNPRQISGESLIGIAGQKYHGFIITLAIIFVYGPLLTEGYYWYDDLWFYDGVKSNYGITISLSMMRPFHGLLGAMFWFVSPSNAYCIKWFSIACLLGYALMMYTWLARKSGQRFFCLIITLALSLFSPLSDHLGYSATITILPSMLAAGLSVIIFDDLFGKTYKKRWFDAILPLIASGCFIVFAFMMHQIAVPIVFLFLIIHIYFNREQVSSFFFCVSYLFFFGLCTIVYLIICKLLIAYYGVAFWERTGFVGVSDVIPKIRWFLHIVLPAAFGRTGLSFLGRLATPVKCYWHFVQYDSDLLRDIVSFVFIGSIIIVCLLFQHCRKKLIESLLMMLFIPMSFFVFLMFKENGYLTYYAIPLLSVILFFFIAAVKETILLLNKIKIYKIYMNPDRMATGILVFLICVLAFQNNVYIRQFWVETNKEGYNCLKNTLSLQTGAKRKIHIFGVLTPGQGNIYSVFAAKLALKELGFNPDDFSITTSDDEQKINVIQADTLETIKKYITPEDLQFMLANYLYDSVYLRYVCNTNDFTRLKRILTQAKLLPEDYNETVIVDLRWITPAWSDRSADEVKQATTLEEIVDANKIISCHNNIVGNIETMDYSSNMAVLHISGWAAMKKVSSKDSQISIILRGPEKILQLTGGNLDSPDVVTYTKKHRYGKCRFDYSIHLSPSEVQPGVYEVWIYIVNKKSNSKAALQWAHPLEIKLSGK